MLYDTNPSLALEKSKTLAALAGRYAKSLTAHCAAVGAVAERLSDGLEATEEDAKACAKSKAVTAKDADADLAIHNARGVVAKVRELAAAMGDLIPRTAKPTSVAKDVQFEEVRERWAMFAQMDKATKAAAAMEALLDSVEQAAANADEEQVVMLLGAVTRTRRTLAA